MGNTSLCAGVRLRRGSPTLNSTLCRRGHPSPMGASTDSCTPHGAIVDRCLPFNVRCDLASHKGFLTIVIRDRFEAHHNGVTCIRDVVFMSDGGRRIRATFLAKTFVRSAACSIVVTTYVKHQMIIFHIAERRVCIRTFAVGGNVASPSSNCELWCYAHRA